MTRLVVRKPMLRPPAPRRAVHAALLAALIFLIGDVALGLAVADDESPSPAKAPPETFGTAAPAVGDAGTYVLSRHRDWPDHREGLSMAARPLEWEWLGDGQGLDADGQPVRFWVATMGESGDHLLIDAATGRPFAQRHTHAQNDSSEQPVGQTPLTTTDHAWFAAESFSFIDGRAHGLPYCGLHHALQGVSLPTNGTLPLLSDCRLPGYDGLQGAGRDVGFRAIRTERLGEHEAVVYRLDPAPPPTQHNPLNDRTYSLTVWLAPDIPYPLRIEAAEHDTGYDIVEVLSLESFRRGARPLDASAPTARPAPPLEFAPTTPWGFEDGDLEHPFPLSMAYQKARDDLDFPDLRQFLADHPKAIMSHAGYAVFHVDGETTRRWTITVADADAHLEFCSYQSSERPQGQTFPPAVRDLLPRGPQRYESEVCDWTGEPVDPADAPAVLPTAASLLARAQAYMDAYGIDAEANAYELFSCGAACGLAPPWIEAGFVEYESTEHVDGELPYLNRDQAWHTAEIRVTVEGETGRFERTDQNDTTRLEDPAPVPTGQDPASAPPALQNVDATVAPGWSMPDGEVLVGMGTVAVTAGLAYYLFPLAKGTFTGLFSRVQPAKAYEHPQRRRIETLLRHEPGLHLAHIARRLDLSRRATRHHLQQLETAGLVTHRKGPRYTCYFLDGSTDRRLMDAAPILHSDGARAVLGVIVRDPDRSLGEIAQATGLTAPTVHHHVGRLVEAGLVTSRRDGRFVRHAATETGRRALG